MGKLRDRMDAASVEDWFGLWASMILHSPSLPLRPASSAESCPVGRLYPLSHFSAFRINWSCNPWRLPGSDRDCQTDAEIATSTQLGVHVGHVPSAWQCWTAPPPKGYLSQDAIQNFPEELARRPSKGSDGGFSNLNFSGGLWGPMEGFWTGE